MRVGIVINAAPDLCYTDIGRTLSRPAGTSRMSKSFVPWTPLRIAVLVAAALGTIFFVGCLAWWWRIDDQRRDGLELIGPVLATVYFVCLILPISVLALRGRALKLAAALAVIAMALASDTLIPWIPWHWLPSPP